MHHFPHFSFVHIFPCFLNQQNRPPPCFLLLFIYFFLFFFLSISTLDPKLSSLFSPIGSSITPILNLSPHWSLIIQSLTIDLLGSLIIKSTPLISNQAQFLINLPPLDFLRVNTNNSFSIHVTHKFPIMLSKLNY